MQSGRPLSTGLGEDEEDRRHLARMILNVVPVQERGGTHQMCNGESGCRSEFRSAREFLAVLPILVFCLLAVTTGQPALAQGVDGSATVVGCDPSKPDPCPGDGNLCTLNVCNPTTHQCEYPAVACQQDGNLCTTESCDPSNGQCVSLPPIDCPGDGNKCTTDTCNPSTGRCESSAPKSCP